MPAGATWGWVGVEGGNEPVKGRPGLEEAVKMWTPAGVGGWGERVWEERFGVEVGVGWGLG